MASDGRSFAKKPDLEAIFALVKCACGFEGHRHLFCPTGLMGVEGVCPACKRPIGIDLVHENEGIDEERSAAVPC